MTTRSWISAGVAVCIVGFNAAAKVQERLRADTELQIEAYRLRNAQIDLDIAERLRLAAVEYQKPKPEPEPRTSPRTNWYSTYLQCTSMRDSICSNLITFPSGGGNYSWGISDTLSWTGSDSIHWVNYLYLDSVGNWKTATGDTTVSYYRTRR
jgi:hypothetical protein